ncbi:hypothetical protein, partial [Escherichia coli]|uniref:hypothetical protein n=1 Tax=Escherichia coli TaxID=562 RepID=UPI001436A0CB
RKKREAREGSEEGCSEEISEKEKGRGKFLEGKNRGRRLKRVVKESCEEGGGRRHGREGEQRKGKPF